MSPQANPERVSLPADLDRVERSLLERLAALTATANNGVTETVLSATVAAELFEAQVGSRVVDHTARWLRAEHGAGYYTIGSAGHESNAAVAFGLRPTDPALLHYRSGGFYFARAAQVATTGVPQDPTGDVLRGMLALSTDQIAGGRHKVFGNKSLNIIPQTSTIASHLPRAVGLALSIGWSGRPDGPPLTRGTAYPTDALVVCSFGDASLNHSTAQGAINWASNTAHRGERVPILFVCEDNGLGISVPTNEGWVADSTLGRPGLEWAQVSGTDPAAVMEVTAEMAETIRDRGIPGLLHLRTVRYLGHAGTDVESAYRAPADITADLGRDPIAATAATVVAAGVCDGPELVDWYLEHRAEVRARAVELWRSNEAELTTAAEVMAPITSVDPQRARAGAIELLRDTGPAPTDTGPANVTAQDGPALTMAQTINRTLAQVLAHEPTSLVFGEDVATKGGVYGVTRGLQDRFGSDRVFDTILDEQSILGLALGASVNGYLPIPEIQYLAYLHNAEDQLRGEAATLSFFSKGQYHNPMVIRVASYGYQKGFGGHFHNDNSVAVLSDIPGLIIASPSHPADAGPLLATCVSAARAYGAVCVYLEPIALYHTTDLYVEGDGRWTYPPLSEPARLGAARVHGDGPDGTMITWANGLHLSLQAQRRLQADRGEQWRVVDLRWLAPLPVADIVREAEATGRVLVVDETRDSGGVGQGVVTALVTEGFRGRIGRVAARDSFVPLGAAANLVLVSRDQIVAATSSL